jgi:hypothetical protein
LSQGSHHYIQKITNELPVTPGIPDDIPPLPGVPRELVVPLAVQVEVPLR